MARKPSGWIISGNVANSAALVAWPIASAGSGTADVLRGRDAASGAGHLFFSGDVEPNNYHRAQCDAANAGVIAYGELKRHDRILRSPDRGVGQLTQPPPGVSGEPLLPDRYRRTRRSSRLNAWTVTGMIPMSINIAGERIGELHQLRRVRALATAGAKQCFGVVRHSRPVAWRDGEHGPDNGRHVRGLFSTRWANDREPDGTRKSAAGALVGR